MKKVALLGIILGLSIGTAVGATVLFDEHIIMPKETSVNLYYNSLQEKNLGIVRIKDGDTTCYVAFYERGEEAASPSISCK